MQRSEVLKVCVVWVLWGCCVCAHRCPAFKILTYYGNAKQRQIKRQGWSKPNAFHVCITSYTLVLQVRANETCMCGLRGGWRTNAFLDTPHCACVPQPAS